MTKAKAPKRFNSYSDFSDLVLDATAFYLAEDSGIIYEWTENGFQPLNAQMIKVKTNDWRTELYLQGVQSEALGLESNYYYAELAAEWPKQYDITKESKETDDAGRPIYTGGFRDEYIKDPSSMDYYLDFSRLPVDDNYRLNRLGIYNIFVRAIDEAGNYSESITVEAEVRKKLITIEADSDQYIIYGDIKADEIEIGYHCITRDGRNVDCAEELLEGDMISGKLYVKNAVYVGTYQIFYDNISIPSDLYYLAYGNVNTFTIKHRTIKLIAHDKEKYYLDEDPELTYEIDTRVCDSNNADYYDKDYRHNVRIEPNSIIYDIVKKENYLVNSIHRMVATKELVEPYAKITSYSEDGLVESFEVENKKFVVGIKWHPELMDDVVIDELFKIFIDKCNN